MSQRNYVGALIFEEEAYNYVAIAYNPVYMKLQKTAVSLIECSIHKGDFFDAERFAQATFDSLKDPANGLDQNSREVAMGYYQLGCVIHKKNGDSVKAEGFLTESLRIRNSVCGSNSQEVRHSVGILAHILGSQNKGQSEEKEF
jgi:hypothetical protein